MGTGQTSTNTQTTVSNKEPKCSICRQPVRSNCDWQQGRCPHRSSMLDQILADPYRSRFFNLINIFKKRK